MYYIHIYIYIYIYTHMCMNTHKHIHTYVSYMVACLALFNNLYCAQLRLGCFGENRALASGKCVRR